MKGNAVHSLLTDGEQPAVPGGAGSSKSKLNRQKKLKVQQKKYRSDSCKKQQSLG